MSVKAQVGDQTIKGALVGAASFFLAKWDLDPGTQAAIMPLLIAGLAYASTLVGDPKQASFLAKASKELPALVQEVTEAAEEKKAVAKKAPAKKAAPKKNPQ